MISKGIFRFAISVFIILSMSLSVFAASVPEPSEDFYVYDGADVISADTEEKIIRQNLELCENTGAQIVLATVSSVEGASLKDFAGEMFVEWGIGDSEKKNGLLILFEIDNEEYWVIPGKGIEKYLTTSTVKSLLDTYLEPSFAEKDYDKGASLIFDKLMAEVTEIYELELAEEPAPVKKGLSTLAVVGIVLAVAAAVIVIALIVRYFLLPGQYRSSHRPRITIDPGASVAPTAPVRRPAPGPRPGAPTGARPGAPTGPRPGAPTGPRPGAPTGPRPGTPTGPRPGAPTGPRPGAPTGPRPGTPTGPRPGAPTGPRPGAPTGARPGAPTGARPNRPGGGSPT